MVRPLPVLLLRGSPPAPAPSSQPRGRALGCGGRALDYLTRASYPFYLLHLPILAVVAHAAVQVPFGVWTKFLGINLLTILATLLACELLVRRTRLTRFLFGLKPAEGIG